MTISIAVTGKGGTGKTTFASLLIRILAEKLNRLILAIDADPNSNLNEALGVPASRTVGDIREKLLEDDTRSVEQSKSEYLEDMIQSSIIEGEGFDLIVMGRPEGPGCYCYVNHLLRKVIDTISDRYPYAIMDAEAGLEHFSRRTTKDLDILLILTDPTMKGINTAKRIVDLVKELNISIKRTYVIANQVPRQITKKLVDQIKKQGLDCIGVVPEDPKIQEFEFKGIPLSNLPKTSSAYQATLSIIEKLPLLVEEKAAWWDKV